MNREQIEKALALPACERLRDFAEVGPAQLASLEAFVDALRGLEAGEPVAEVTSAVNGNYSAKVQVRWFGAMPKVGTKLYANIAPDGMVPVPREKLIQCMKTLDADGDEHGVAAVMERWLAAAEGKR